MKISELAERTGARVEGLTDDIEITGAAGLDDAGDGHVTFLANPRYTPRVNSTRASAIYLSEEAQTDRPIAILRVKDPGKVVVDEVAGQMIALLPVSLFALGKVWIIISFILFRLFDIFKPYPARRFEALRSGLGIMADDLVAGFYAAVIVTLIVIVR